MSVRFDEFGLPDGQQQAWVDLCLRVEADAHTAGWDQPAALYGVLSPSATAAELGPDLEQWRTRLSSLTAGTTPGVLLDVVRAGTDPDPWRLLVGQSAPPTVSAVVLVWRSMGWPAVDGHVDVSAPAVPMRRVHLITRSGADAAVIRLAGHDPAPVTRDSAPPLLTSALGRMLGHPARPCPHPVSAWLARRVMEAACPALLALGGHMPARWPRALVRAWTAPLLGAPANVRETVLVDLSQRAVLAAALNVCAQLGALPTAHALRPWDSAEDLNQLCVAASRTAARTWGQLLSDEHTLAALPPDVTTHRGWFDPDLAGWAAMSSVLPVANTLAEVTEKVSATAADVAATTLAALGWVDV